MLALGGLLISAALLTLAAFAVVVRRPHPPRWATWGWIHELVTVAVAGLLTIGVGHLVAAGMAAYREGPQLVDLGLLAAVLCIAFLIWRRLDVRARLKAFRSVTRARGPAPTIAAARGASPLHVQPGMPTAPTEPPPSRPRDRAA